MPGQAAAEIEQRIQSLSGEEKASWEELNALFLKTVG